MEQNSSRRDGREFGQTMNKNYRHKRCARSCAARASKKNEKKKTNFNSLTLPPKELEAQEMRPLLRRPRFEEKNKKEKKFQHHVLDGAAKKKKTNASDVPALPPAALRKELSKKQVVAAPHFFGGVVVVA